MAAAEATFVEVLDTAQAYLELQQQLSQQLKQGLFDLARAKYSMGPIGQAQYDSEMQATSLATVQAAQGENGCSRQGQRYRFKPCDGPRPREAAAQQGEEGVAGSSDDEEGCEEDFAFLRRLREEADEVGGSCAHGAAAASSTGKGGRLAGRRHGAEPLHWFGVLVPPALKDSQASFRQALETVIKLANAAEQLRHGTSAGPGGTSVEQGCR